MRVTVGDRGGAGSPDYVSLQPVSADVLADDVVQRFDSTGMFHYCCPRPIEDCLIVSHRPINCMEFRVRPHRQRIRCNLDAYYGQADRMNLLVLNRLPLAFYPLA